MLLRHPLTGWRNSRHLVADVNLWKTASMEKPKRIDPSVANGLAGQMISDITRIGMLNKTIPDLNPYTRIGRKKSIMKVAKSIEPLLLDKIAHDDFKMATFLEIIAGDLPDGPSVLIANLKQVDFNPILNKKPDAAFDRVGGLTNIGQLCSISRHAIARIIQRLGIRDRDEILDILHAAANWAAVSNFAIHSGSFMMPVKKGLICCGMDIELRSKRLTRMGAKGTFVRTFIGHNQMRPESLRRWQRMVDAGALEDIPRAVRRSPVSDRHLEIFAIMAEEGKLWDARREHAINKKAMMQERRRKAHPSLEAPDQA